MLDFKYRVFLSVGKHLSFSKAAKALGLTQPAVSFQIRQLEEELHARLFIRHPGKIELTPLGDSLYKEALGMQSDACRIQEMVMEKVDRMWGSISVGASTTIGNYFLPPILSQFKSKFNEVSIKVIVDNTDEILAHLADGIVDFALVEGPVKAKHWIVEEAFVDELVVIAPRNFPGADKGMITRKQLAGQPFISRETGSGTRAVIDSIKQGKELLVPHENVVLELGSNTAIKRVVEAGLGVSIVSLMTLEKEMQLQSLSILRIPGLPMYRSISFVYQKGVESGKLVREMVILCKEKGKIISAKGHGKSPLLT